MTGTGCIEDVTGYTAEQHGRFGHSTPEYYGRSGDLPGQ